MHLVKFQNNLTDNSESSIASFILHKLYITTCLFVFSLALVPVIYRFFTMLWAIIVYSTTNNNQSNQSTQLTVVHNNVCKTYTQYNIDDNWDSSDDDSDSD